MGSRRVHWIAPLSLPTLVFAAMALLVAPLPGDAVMAQEATPAATGATALPAATATITVTRTPTVTLTPTLTPTNTPTFTVLQARLAVANAYLAGGEYAKAAEIFAAVALEDRGNPEALAGLQAALQAQPGPTATPQVQTPAERAGATPEPARASFVETFSRKLSDFVAVALAAVSAIVLACLLVLGLRWLLAAVRELWFTRAQRPPVPPKLLIGDFVNATGDDEFQGSKIVGQALAEQLVRWNEAVQPELQQPVEVDALAAAGLGWLRTLWRQIVLPERAYRATGVLFGKRPGPYRLSVDRLDLRTRAVDASYTFETYAETPGQAFRDMAAAAALWLRDPLGMQAYPLAMAVPPRAAGMSEPSAPGPLQVAGEALKLMASIRQQIVRGTVDYTAAPRSLNEAQALIQRLPADSSLRRDLQSSLDDLRRHVQPGAAP